MLGSRNLIIAPPRQPQYSAAPAVFLFLIVLLILGGIALAGVGLGYWRLSKQIAALAANQKQCVSIEAYDKLAEANNRLVTAVTNLQNFLREQGSFNYTMEGQLSNLFVKMDEYDAKLQKAEAAMYPVEEWTNRVQVLDSGYKNLQRSMIKLSQGMQGFQRLLTNNIPVNTASAPTRTEDLPTP